jgi:hypothetical protein
MDTNLVRLWRHWIWSCVEHGFCSDLSVCDGYLRMMRRDFDSPSAVADTRIRFHSMVREATAAADRINVFLNTLSVVLKSRDVDEIVRALAEQSAPRVNLVVTDEARHIPCPNEALTPVLWLLIDSQARSRSAGEDGSPLTAFVVFRVDDHGCCEIVIGPAERERGPEWADVTAQACSPDGWLGGMAAALQAGGQDIRVKTNGPLSEVIIRWQR